MQATTSETGPQIRPAATRALPLMSSPAASTWLLRDGCCLTLRPVRSQDAPLLGQLLDDGLQPGCRRLRFHGALGRLSPARLAWLAEVDFDRHVAFVVTRPVPGGEQALGEGRYVLLADGSAELALAVGTEWQRMGIGSRLLGALLTEAQRRGVPSLHGDMQLHNVAMRALMQLHGFVCHAVPDDSLLVRGALHCAARSATLQARWQRVVTTALRGWLRVRQALGPASAARA
jgi:GNAT superfamily N-acetyltransferase